MRLQVSRARSSGRSGSVKQQSPVTHHSTSHQCKINGCHSSVNLPSNFCRYREGNWDETAEYGEPNQDSRNVSSLTYMPNHAHAKEENISFSKGYNNTGEETHSYNPPSSTYVPHHIRAKEGLLFSNSYEHTAEATDSYNSPSSQTSSTYNTSYTSYTTSIESTDSDDLLLSNDSKSAYFTGIGDWVDSSSLGSPWTTQRNPDILLEHAFSASPNVEEAMKSFQTSFYGVGEVGTVEHR